MRIVNDTCKGNTDGSLWLVVDLSQHKGYTHIGIQTTATIRFVFYKFLASKQRVARII